MVDLRREAILNWTAFFCLGFYLLLAAASFPTFVEPSLKGVNGWRAYDDSDIYLQTADYIHRLGGGEAIAALASLARNLILPAFIALLFQTNLNIALFNLALFLLALLILTCTFSRFKWYVFLPLILASPNTYQGLLTLNKEIFVFFSAVALANWFKTRSSMVMAFLLLLSVVLRWEQALVLVVFLIFLRLRIPPKKVFVLLIFGISLLYPVAMGSVDIGIDPKEQSSSALFAFINRLQSYGLYFILLIPKLAITLFSQIVRFWKPFTDTERLHDLSTGAFVIADQLCLCTVLILSQIRKLWVKENPVTYFVVVYGIVFLASPENSPRYLYLIYILMSIALAAPELQALRIPQGAKDSRQKSNRHLHRSCSLQSHRALNADAM